jgi:hypothetical protein
MLDISRQIDALAATAILVKMAGDGVVAPARIPNDGFSQEGRHGIESGPALLTNFLVESDEGSMQSCWLRVFDASRQLPDALVSGLQRGGFWADIWTPSWVQGLYDASRAEITDDHIIEMFDALEKAIYGDLNGLDTTLAVVDMKRLAPEFIVGISRGLFPLKDHLFNWRPFVLRAWNELSSRNGLDVRELLQGLL